MKECLECHMVFGNTSNKFCSQSCSAKFNNKKRMRISRNPCIVCETPTGRSGATFCSRSCCAQFQKNRPRGSGMSAILNKKALKKCSVCPKEIEEAKTFCSKSCMDNQKEERLTRWRQGEDVGFSAVTLRWLLRKEDGLSCSLCKNEKWNGLPIALEVEHVDGNSENNKRENVCLLCPNCHAQTPTYKSKNKGNGRSVRMGRYRAGKSF